MNTETVKAIENTITYHRNFLKGIEEEIVRNTASLKKARKAAAAYRSAIAALEADLPSAGSA